MFIVARDSIFSTPYPVRKGLYVTLHHNIVRNITADLLTEICKDVRIESTLPKITGEEMSKGSIKLNKTRLGVNARDFWMHFSI